LAMDKPAGSKEQFEKRGLKNFETRSLHHHVFDIPLLRQIYGFLNVEVVFVYDKDQDLVILGRYDGV